MRTTLIALAVTAAACAADTAPVAETSAEKLLATAPPVGDRYELDDAAWRERLEPFAFEILRRAGTERAFTGAYWDHKADGIYACAGCGAPLFDSAHKYRSGTGWPSWYQAIEAGRVGERRDTSHGMVRTEIVCSRCDGHLGHVFSDGPEPTGLRYCVNSASVRFHARTPDKAATASE